MLDREVFNTFMDIKEYYRANKEDREQVKALTEYLLMAYANIEVNE